MSADRPGDGMTRFGPGELPADGVRPDELDAEIRLGRELEGIAGLGAVRPSADFADRVMAVIDAEPVPAPVIAAGSALRGGSAAAFLASIRDAFRVTFGSGFPAAARMQALALVLVVVLAAGGTGIVAARAVGLFDQHAPTPTLIPRPTPSPAPPRLSPSPSPSLLPTPSTTPDATDSAEPSETPEATGPDPTGTDDHGGGSGSGSGSGDGSGSGSGDGSGSGSSGSGSSGGGTRTAQPTEDRGGEDHTPPPTDTPRPTGEDGSGHG